MSNQEDCIFCKIVAGDIPSAKVYEDDEVYAFLDLSQVTKGHTLVVPKQHAKNMYEIPSDLAGKLYERVPKIARGIKDAYQPIGLNILNNNEEPAGQSVFHVHIHLLPRYGKEDGFKPVWETHNDDYTQDQLGEIADKISSTIGD